MSVVDHVLCRHGLRWELYPYRIVVDTHPHLIVQDGPRFDLRESALKGARERALAAERKRRQRAVQNHRDVTSKEQYKAPIGVPLAGLEAKNASTEGNLDPPPAKS
jgi:hypothetical protein